MRSESTRPLSPAGRRASLAAMAESPLDLLVIGGGITGAGVARDAALRGMRVGLVEKRDFGSGTSSRSSKIIHGGVRYLEYLQFGLVRESARERRILERIAPHLVHPLPFLYPVYEGESLLKIRAGLRLFDAMAGTPRSQRSRRLSPEETRKLLPGLRDPLRGAVLYPEYITDDARFTLANIASAARNGAFVANYARADEFLLQNGRVLGAVVTDLEEGTKLEIRAEVTVNATGPWVSEVLEGGGLRIPKPIIPSKGIHILLSRERLPLQAATFLRSPSGRRGLAMPRGPWVYVGTSDDEFRGDLDNPVANADEIADLLRMAQDCFPHAELAPADVRACWAGIRPLIFEAGKSTRDTSRHDEVWHSPPGLVTVAGGKLTTYRPMALRILEQVERARGRDLPGRERTSEDPLPGAPSEPLPEFRERIGAALARQEVGEEALERLHFLYGSELETLLSYGAEDSSWLAPLSPSLPALRGEVRLAVEHGMALHLDDLLDRRMALLLFTEDGGVSGMHEAASIMGSKLGWSEAVREAELERYQATVRSHRTSSVIPPGSPQT